MNEKDSEKIEQKSRGQRRRAKHKPEKNSRAQNLHSPYEALTKKNLKNGNSKKLNKSKKSNWSKQKLRVSHIDYR